jgi:hypothetical protein
VTQGDRKMSRDVDSVQVRGEVRPGSGDHVYLAGLPEVMEAPSGFGGDPVALVQLPQQQTAGIRGYPATLKIGADFSGEKAFKGKSNMADCGHRVSRLRS